MKKKDIRNVIYGAILILILLIASHYEYEYELEDVHSTIDCMAEDSIVDSY